MMRILTTLLVLCSFFPLTGEAAIPSRYHSAKYRVSKIKVQQHYSFIPAYKPSDTISRLQNSLTGRVVEQFRIPAQPIQPKDVQIFLKPETQGAQEAHILPHPMATTLKTKHHTWRWFHFELASHRPQKLRVRSEVLTRENSFVVPVTSADAAQLSGLIAGLIKEQIPDTKNRLLLEAVPASQAGNTLTLNLQYVLKHLGYTLVSKAPSLTPTVRYRLSNLDKALLIRVNVNGVETARLYERSFSGALVAASPMTRINRSQP